MPIEHIAEFNGSLNAGETISYVAQSDPSFTPWILFIIFLAFSLTFLLGRKLNAKSNFLASFATSAVITSVVAISLTAFDNAINSYTLSSCLAITGALLLLYFLSEK